LVIKSIIKGFIILTFVSCQQTQAKTINLTAELFPPQTNQDGSGQQFDVVRAIFEPYGYSIKVHVYPYRRVIHLLENEKMDMAVGVAKNENNRLLFSDEPHDSDNLVAVFPKNSKVNWQGDHSLLGKRLLFIAGLSEGLIKEFSTSSKLDLSSSEISEVNTRVQALNKLLLKRDDFLIDCECGLFLNEVLSYRSQFIVKKIGFIKIYAAFSRTEKGRKLKKVWQRDFPKFIRTEAARNIYKKWGLMREYRNIQDTVKSDSSSLPNF